MITNLDLLGIESTQKYEVQIALGVPIIAIQVTKGVEFWAKKKHMG
jgi:hypothetical protein